VSSHIRAAGRLPSTAPDKVPGSKILTRVLGRRRPSPSGPRGAFSQEEPTTRIRPNGGNRPAPPYGRRIQPRPGVSRTLAEGWGGDSATDRAEAATGTE